MSDLFLALHEAVWWHPVILALAAFGTRILPRLFCPEARGSDAYFHLLAARKIRENRFRFPETFPECRLPGEYDYPPLFHYLIAAFPQSWHLQIERFSSAVIDTAHGITLYAASLYCLSKSSVSADTATLSFWVSLLFLMSPSLTSIGTGPRAYQGTPRTLGELLFTLSMLFSMQYAAGGGPVSFLLASGFGGLLMLTSKFGIQAFLFCHAAFLVSFRDLAWLALPAASFGFACAFSFGNYLKVATGHWEHSRYYLKAISKRFYMVRQKNRWADIVKLPGNMFRDPKRAARTLLMDNTYLLLLIKHPQLIYVIGVLATARNGMGPFDSYLLVWMAAGLIAFFLTSLKPFLFLGEADRYLEYILVPQVLVLGMTGNLVPFAYFLFAYEVLLYGIYAAIFVHEYSNKARDLPAFREMVSFLRSSTDIRAVLPVYNNDALQIAFESGKGVAHFTANFRARYLPYEAFLSFYDKVYPFPNEELRPLMKQYGFDAVCYSESDLRKAEQNGLKYDFKGWRVVFSNSCCKVLTPGS